MESAHTCFQLRVQCSRSACLPFPAALLAQTGPSEPQVIAAASTAKINVGAHKLAGQIVATVRVGDDGKVREVLVTENTAESVFEPQLVKVLQSARFRPAIDASGKPIESSVEMKVELRPSTGAEPKPVAAKADPQLTDKEKARIRKMKCSDFVWEWEADREMKPTTRPPPNSCRASPSPCTQPCVPRPANTSTPRSGRPPPRPSRNPPTAAATDPQAPFWEGVFKSVMDEAVPK